MILKILPLLVMVMGAGVIRAQIGTTAGTVTSCPGNIVVPVTVANCNGVGAISLVLTFDSSKLDYLGYQNVNGSLTGGLLVISSSGNRVIFTWANGAGASPGTATLVEFRFSAVPSTTTLAWDTQTPGNCEYTDVNGVVLASTFTNGTATIQQPPLISTQPVNTSVLVGGNTTFHTGATATGITYLWQYSPNGGTNWYDLSNNSTYSGVTGATLYIYGATLPMNGYKYRCRLTGTCPPVTNTNEVTLTVINPVTTILPTASLCPGAINIPVTVTNFTGVAAFSLTFSYNPSCLTYTGWTSLNGALSGGNFVINNTGGKVYMTWSNAAAATIGDGTIIILQFTGVTGSSPLTWFTTDEGYCEYSDINGVLLTSVWTNGNETIYGVPTVTSNPVNRTIAKGQNTTFGIAATGQGLSYLWQYSTDNGNTFNNLSNGGYYSGVSTATLTITGAQLALSGYQYRCRVSGTCTPVVFSDPGILTVLPNIITTCGTATVCPGQTVIPITVTDFIGVGSFSLTINYNTSLFTYTGYQNLHANVTAGNFIANASGGKVYLTWSDVAAITVPNGNTLVELKFNGIPGSANFTWDTGTPGNCEYVDANGLVIFSTWNNGSATVNAPPAVTSDPVNRTIYGLGSTTFTVAANGTGLSYRWQVSTNGGTIWTNLNNGSPYSGVTTATLTVNPAATGMNGYKYHCVVSGTCPPTDTSAAASLTVTQDLITTTAGSVSNSCTGNLNIPVSVNNCLNVGSISLMLIFDTTKMTFEGYHTVNAGLSGGFLVINRYANRVIFSWASTTPCNIGSGTLVQYRFRANAGISSTQTWDTQSSGACEYSDPLGTIIASQYTNSNITVKAGALIVNAGPDVQMVFNSVQLNGTATGGTAPYTWLWSPSGTLSNPNIANPVASPTATTNYTVTVTDNLGCSGSDPVTVTVPAVPQNLTLQNVTIPGGTSNCYNASQTITVAGGGSTFVVQNGGEALMIAGQNIFFLPGTSVQTGGYLHAWITTAGEYCTSLPPPLAPASIVSSVPFTHEPATSSFCRVFPNPTTGDFTVEVRDGGLTRDAQVVVYGSRGEVITTGQLTGHIPGKFTLSGNPAGLYFVRVTDGEKAYTKKLILQP